MLVLIIINKGSLRTRFKNTDLHLIAIINVKSKLRFTWMDVFRQFLFSSLANRFNFSGFFSSKFSFFLFSSQNITACLVSFATETVMQLCHGRRRCNISADTQTFGNPCRPDSRMYLKTVYTCGKCCFRCFYDISFFSLDRQ